MWRLWLLLLLASFIIGGLAFYHPEAIVKVVEDMPLSPMEEAQLLRYLHEASEVIPVQAEIQEQVVLPLRWLMGIPFMPVWIEGKQHFLQFDPGSRYTHIYPALARQLSGLMLISKDKEMVAESPTGRFRFYLAQVREMYLGSARISNEVVSIPLLKTFAKLFGFLTIYEYPGLLGLRTLKPFSVTIDLSGSKLILHPRGVIPSQEALTISFELHLDNMFLLAYLNGHGPFWLLLDPGAPGTVIAPSVARQLGLDPQKPFSLTLEVAGQRIAEGLKARAMPFLEEVKREDSKGIDGLLGRDFLKRWVVTIDFDRQQLYLIPAHLKH